MVFPDVSGAIACVGHDARQGEGDHVLGGLELVVAVLVTILPVAVIVQSRHDHGERLAEQLVAVAKAFRKMVMSAATALIAGVFATGSP